MKDPYTQSNYRIISSSSNTSPLKPSPYIYNQMPTLSDSDTNSPLLIKQMSNNSHSKTTFFSFPIKTESTASTYLPSYSRGYFLTYIRVSYFRTLDTPKEHDGQFNPEATPRGINNFNEEEMDEFCQNTGVKLIQRQSSDKIPSTSLKKCMSDITTKVGRNKSISFTSLVRTQSTETGNSGLNIAGTRARADTGNKKSFFKEEVSRLKNRASSPGKQQNNVSLLNFSENLDLMER